MEKKRGKHNINKKDNARPLGGHQRRQVIPLDDFIRVAILLVPRHDAVQGGAGEPIELFAFLEQKILTTQAHTGTHTHTHTHTGQEGKCLHYI
jgi:hypothetical protein